MNKQDILSFVSFLLGIHGIGKIILNYSVTLVCTCLTDFIISRRALPPPAHHSSARPVLAAHASHPLPAHMQPAAVFPAHPQVAAAAAAAAAATYGYAPLSPAKSQYQHLWYAE